MKRLFAIAAIFVLLLPWVGPAWCHNPFTSKPESQHIAPEPPIKSQFFVKIIVWQHQLKQKMSDLIREFQSDGRWGPLIILMGLAYAYGTIHAAGPGHGKVVAMSYVLSHRPSFLGGMGFGLCIAMIHGLSGIVGVLGLRYIIQRSVSQTLASVTDITQMVSFGLIAILGVGILAKHTYALFFIPESKREPERVVGKNVWPWAVAVGVVPCPAVVMVMLFCLSMDVMLLGLLLAICISFGMGTTISIVVSTIIMGKAGVLRAVPEKRIRRVETTVGMLSGSAIAVFGILFLVSAINATFY